MCLCSLTEGSEELVRNGLVSEAARNAYFRAIEAGQTHREAMVRAAQAELDDMPLHTILRRGVELVADAYRRASHAG